MSMARVMIVASLAESLVNFRGDLIRYFIARGHEVIALAPGNAPAVDSQLASWGVRRLVIGMQRTGFNPIEDLRLLLQLFRLTRSEKPDVVIAYTIKPVVYAMLAARWVGVPRRAAMITGLGFAFSTPATLAQRLMQLLARMLYRISMSCTDTVFFQNPDDEYEFRQAGLLRPTQLVVRTAGSGINLERYALAPMPAEPLNFLMIARLLVNKGIREYLQAASTVRASRPDLNFHLVGPQEDHPSALRRNELESSISRGDVIYHGPVADVRPHLASCHVYVLPSYREGTPRSVLEAMAVGRPVITTDTPGCRETVTDGDNGLLVCPADTGSLVKAMLRMAEICTTERARMAERSRVMAVNRFDVKAVNSKIASTLAL